jgi:hypothetical protein
MRALGALLFASCILAACSSEEKTEPTRTRAAGDAAAVSTAQATERAERAKNEPPPRTEDPTAPAASGPAAASAPRGPRDARAERERIIEDATAEDRPSGGSEMRIEADGAVYRPGVGVLPRYSVRAVEKKDPPPPDEAVMKFVPGSKVELPPPEAKPPREIPGEKVLVPSEAK